MTPQTGPSSSESGRGDCGMAQDTQNRTGEYRPIQVWTANGYTYTDYRLKNGCIVSVETGVA
jgi:hypothetical protein